VKHRGTVRFYPAMTVKFKERFFRNWVPVSSVREIPEEDL